MVSLIVGFIAAFLLAALPGGAVIARLKQLGAKQNVSADAPQTHNKKQGTPTMGGVLILFSLTVTILVYLGIQWGAHRRPTQEMELLVLLILTLAFGAIGFADDWLSLRRGKNLGLRARDKFLAQCLVGAGFVFWLAANAQSGVTTQIQLAPSQILNNLASGQIVLDPGWWYYPLALILLVGFSNATNISDGLDGLSSGLTLIIALTLAALVGVMRPDLAFFAVALAGALAGFLWWNAPPARVFMGDTASLALGAALVGVALIGKQEIGLIVASLVCWAELISVMIQVSVFKWRRRTKGKDYASAHRVFRRTPLHHHFEELGVPETRVVLHFWLAGGLFAALALLWSR